MKVELDILGFGVASSSVLPLPSARVAALPQAKFHSRKARLPGLALELSQLALGALASDEACSVLVGTALGCLTETAAFVENMIREDGASPKPRAFTASVHNAIASEVARHLGARGECQTFVQGELSYIAPLFAAARARARGFRGTQLVGALDEWTPYVGRGFEACELDGRPAEGGALFRIGAAKDLRASDGVMDACAPLARVTEIALGRPRDPAAFFAARIEEVDAVLASRASLHGAGERGVDVTSITGEFASAGALALALATALLAGETDGAPFGLERRPRRLGVLSTTRFGEWGWLALEAAQA